MLINCDWLPPLELQQPTESDADYENRIYQIFCSDFCPSRVQFDNLPVIARRSPMVNGKLQSFYHVTTWGNNQTNRSVDKKRQERIRWIRAFIEHADCQPHGCDECEGMKLWIVPFHGKPRIKILLSEEKYVVILEKRADRVFLITAYFIDYDHRLEKMLAEYKKTKDAST